ncbi:aldo/keto reductase [Arthrobacter sp. 260]|uniref:aldo/keto reductase n=1 Tax=Arthrobacter sp. 260 TaxID=2735314 RepID=UPI001490FBA1|nr:aldo/keto reductase [Arthrobacter sp. 260]NOJ61518.1 aldo/keto reductase [Arthrobacter sp. 260]
MHKAPKIALNNGVQIDQVGYGVYKVPPETTADLCAQALEVGYRTIDTAAMYGNEAGVGRAVTDAVNAGWLERDDVFVTTKLWNDNHGYEATLRAFDASQQALGLDDVDLYLIHWPCPDKDQYVDTFRALEQLYHDGRVRAIGVSNFQVTHLERLLAETGVIPAVNQIELHPYLQQHELRQFHDTHGIRTQAWSPLGRGAILADPVIGEIASDLDRTPAQVVLRWHVQSGNLVIPKASTRARIAGNLDIFGFDLTPGQLADIGGLERDTRFGSHPDRVN